jgi:hypothetical protein
MQRNAATSPATLYDIVFAGVDVPKDDGVEALLRMFMSAAWQELRLEDDYHKVFVQEAVTALERDVADGFYRIEARLARVETRIEDVAEAVENIATANRDLMEALAARFRISDAFDLPDAALRAELEKRAEDYRRVLQEIAELKGVSDRIDNIHAAAMDAVRNLRLGEARQLLRDAREVLRAERLRPVLEDNAKLMVAEAEIELLDQNPETAFTILSAAAESFASIDPLEPARKRGSYEDLLYQHGLRYPGPALVLAARMMRDALKDAPRDTNAELWAALQNDLGNSLADLGARSGDTDVLHGAVTAYRAALEVRTRQASPMHWASTQNNLGTALGDLGTRAGDTDALQDAITAFRAALEVRTREASPMHWATTQNNLGNALRPRHPRGRHRRAAGRRHRLPRRAGGPHAGGGAVSSTRKRWKTSPSSTSTAPTSPTPPTGHRPRRCPRRLGHSACHLHVRSNAISPRQSHPPPRAHPRRHERHP